MLFIHLNIKHGILHLTKVDNNNDKNKDIGDGDDGSKEEILKLFSNISKE